MTTVLIDYNGASHSNASWNKVANSSIANLIADDGVTETGWGLIGDFGLPSDSTGSSSTSGDASWVNISQVSQGFRLNTQTEGTYVGNTITGLNNNRTYNITCFSSISAGSRTTRWRVQGGDTQDLSATSNSTNVVTFLNVSPIDGEILIEWTKSPGSGNAPANAVRIIENESTNPSISLDGVFAPNTLETVSTGNFSGIPTEIVFTDTGNNSLPLSLTSDGNDYTFSFPALPDAGNNTAGLLFGEVTGTITVSEESAFDTGELQVPNGYALSTLVEGFDTYLFQEWGEDEPSVGWQIVYPTANNTIINEFAELQTDATEQFDIWIVDLDGHWYGRYLDPTLIMSSGFTSLTRFSLGIGFSLTTGMG